MINLYFLFQKKLEIMETALKKIKIDEIFPDKSKEANLTIL